MFDGSPKERGLHETTNTTLQTRRSLATDAEWTRLPNILDYEQSASDQYDIRIKSKLPITVNSTKLHGEQLSTIPVGVPVDHQRISSFTNQPVDQSRALLIQPTCTVPQSGAATGGDTAATGGDTTAGGGGAGGDTAAAGGAGGAAADGAAAGTVLLDRTNIRKAKERRRQLNLGVSKHGGFSFYLVKSAVVGEGDPRQSENVHHKTKRKRAPQSRSNDQHSELHLLADMAKLLATGATGKQRRRQHPTDSAAQLLGAFCPPAQRLKRGHRSTSPNSVIGFEANNTRFSRTIFASFHVNFGPSASPFPQVFAMPSSFEHLHPFALPIVQDRENMLDTCSSFDQVEAYAEGWKKVSEKLYGHDLDGDEDITFIAAMALLAAHLPQEVHQTSNMVIERSHKLRLQHLTAKKADEDPTCAYDFACDKLTAASRFDCLPASLGTIVEHPVTVLKTSPKHPGGRFTVRSAGTVSLTPDAAVNRTRTGKRLLVMGELKVDNDLKHTAEEEVFVEVGLKPKSPRSTVANVAEIQLVWLNMLREMLVDRQYARNRQQAGDGASGYIWDTMYNTGKLGNTVTKQDVKYMKKCSNWLKATYQRLYRAYKISCAKNDWDAQTEFPVDIFKPERNNLSIAIVTMKLVYYLNKCMFRCDKHATLLSLRCHRLMQHCLVKNDRRQDPQVTDECESHVHRVLCDVTS